MKRRTGTLPVLVVAAVLVLFGAAWGMAAETLRVNGSGIALDMMKPMLKAFEEENQGYKVVMERPLGSSGALKALMAGALDLVVSSKKLTPELTAQGAVSSEYGITPLAIVVNRDVPASNLTTTELEEMYSGRRGTWPNGERVRVVMRPESDIDTVILRGLSPGMDAAINKAKATPGLLMAVTDPESNEAVSKTPGALGASGMSGVLQGEFALKTVALNGVEPTVKNLGEGRYPLGKDIRFVTLQNPSAGVKALMVFANSPKGQAIAEKAGVLYKGTPPGSK